MAEVLILSLIFRPDNVSTAQLMSDLAEDLQALGHRVTVVTTMPHYNRDPIAEAEQPFTNGWCGLLKQSRYHGMTVYHTWMPAKGRNKLYRMLTWIAFHGISTVAGCLKVPRPDVILCPSPPLTIGLSAWVLAAFHRAKFIYNVQEIYPDVAINLGAVRNKWIIRRLLWLERFVYKKAAAVTVISSRMRMRLLEKGVPPGKLKLIPNCVDVGGFIPTSKDNEFSRAYNVQDKFVVSYAGNMGKPQHLETLIEAAALLRHRNDIQIVMIGNGTELDDLRQRATNLQLSNVTFVPQQPYAVMPLAYAAMDLSYVPQALGTSNDGIPSKVYRILAAGRPVLACTDMDSDLATLIEEAHAGFVVTTAAPAALAMAIENAAADQTACREMGLNGRAHVVKLYDRHIVSAAYSDLIASVAAATAS